MLKRLMVAAMAALGASMAFGSIHNVATMVIAKPKPLALTSSALKITELLINPQGTDNGNEYFEIKNTSGATIDLKDVWFVYIDGEKSEEGEVDSVFRLGTGANRDQTRNLAAGAVIVFRDQVGSGSPATINDQGGTVVNVDFENAAGIGDSMRNSLGMFALVTGVSGLSTGNQLDTETWSGGVKVNNDPNGILDFTENTASDNKWSDTFDVIDMKRALNETGDEYYYSASTLPDANSSGFEVLVCDQQGTWTPDGITRMTNSGLWTNGVIYDTATKTSSPTFYFNFVVASEYTWAVDIGSLSTVSGNTRCSPGLADGSQLVVTDGSVNWAH